MQTDIDLEKIEKEFKMTINKINKKIKFNFVFKELKLESIWNEEETEVLDIIGALCVLKETTKEVELKLYGSGFSDREILNDFFLNISSRILHEDF